ncbi:hypothetical protein [Alkalicoccus daliensis]|nr:hypothetical protein [Alkalicoccus daliensis]
MKHIYAFESGSEFRQHQSFIEDVKKKLAAYELFLKQHFTLTALPKAV